MGRQEGIRSGKGGCFGSEAGSGGDFASGLDFFWPVCNDDLLVRVRDEHCFQTPSCRKDEIPSCGIVMGKSV